MRSKFVELLACPICGGDLELTPTESADGHVLAGALACAGCAASFPIVGGVPRLLPDDARRSDVRENTAHRFGYEWNTFSDFSLDEERTSFETWMRPRKLSDLAGLTVLEAGCGMGRHAVLADQAGVGRLVGVDLGNAVDAAFANTRRLETACIVQGDIYHPPVKSAAFDAGYSVGVLHHLPDPAAGFRALAPKIKPGGWFHVWLYGREGNGWIVWIVDPIRSLTARLPLPILEKLCWLLTVPLVLAARTVYRLPFVGPRLPYAGYIRWLSAYSVRKIHAIVFDHALAPVAHYMRRQEVEAMIDIPEWKLEAIEHSRGMSWGATAVRAADPAGQPQPVPAPAAC